MPTAVAPSVLTPGIYILVSLLSGSPAPGTGLLRVLLASPRSSSGDLTVDTEVRTGGGPDSAGTAFGPGTPGHLAAKQIYAKYPAAVIDFIAPTAGAGSAVLSVTASGSPAANTAVNFDVMGRQFQVAWNALETADTFKTRAITEINSRASDFNCTAASGGTGVITFTGRVLGRISNDVLVKVTLANAQNGTEALAGASTYTNLAGGTTDADFTTALASAKGTEYAYIAVCTSNVDAELTSGGNASRVKTHISTYNTGKDASLQQAVIASTRTQAAAKAAAVALNTGVFEYVQCVNGRSLPAEFVGREIGGRLVAESVDPAANRIGEEFDGVYASANPVTDRLTQPQSEDAIGNGLSPISYTSNGTAVLLRPITTYSVDASGAADRRLLDVQNVSATYAVVRDMRQALPAEFPGAKIMKDALPTEEPPPKGVTEERDIKAFVIGRLRFWQRTGVIQKATLDQVIADGTLSVTVNPTDSTQVDINMPMRIIQPLAKFGVTAQRLAG
jgi:phage tail sheath gpL-like